jgi:two-component system sensor histidine kinase UhpB
VSLFWRIFLLNAAVLVAATVLLTLGPVTVSTPVLPTEALILAAGVGLCASGTRSSPAGIG